MAFEHTNIGYIMPTIVSSIILIKLTALYSFRINSVIKVFKIRSCTEIFVIEIEIIYTIKQCVLRLIKNCAIHRVWIVHVAAHMSDRTIIESEHRQ